MAIRKIIEYLFFSMISAIGTFAVSYLHNISSCMERLAKSDREFNLKIELMTEKLVEASDTLKDHESRIRKIERTE